MVEGDATLQQIALTPEEIATIFALVPNVGIIRPSASTKEINDEARNSEDASNTFIPNTFTLTNAEKLAIFETKGKILFSNVFFKISRGLDPLYQCPSPYSPWKQNKSPKPNY